MTPDLFKDVASSMQNPDYNNHVKREIELYERKNDIRSPYERDYTRILHSLAYRRLKHKTQVFFNIDNDHICTRMEHVQHVESVGCTIAKYLGLNVDLTRAIAMGHDLGHAPFGHEGENELTKIRNQYGMDKFWHERNSLRMIDDIELLQNHEGCFKNLDLTYAVRDGIISHCGEVDENGIKPRHSYIDLTDFNEPGQYQPYTWEGCVVKIADKIAYLGRDIEDAIRLDFLDKRALAHLRRIATKYHKSKINTTVIMHDFIISICENSTPNNGICLGSEYSEMLNEIKKFNYDNIYYNEKLDVYKKYVSLIIRSIFDFLIDKYAGERTIEKLTKIQVAYPLSVGDFIQYLFHYSSIVPTQKKMKEKYTDKYENKKIYGKLEEKNIYAEAIVDYIAGMTDKYAIAVFNELITFR